MPLLSFAITYQYIDIANAFSAQSGAVSRRLFGRHGEGLTGFLNHLSHFADAFGALGLALIASEDVARPAGPRFDGQGHVTLPKTIAVADVHGRLDPASDANGSL